MTLFVVGFFVIAAVVSILWLMVRPLANEPVALPRAEPAASIFGAEDQARYNEDADASGLPPLPAEERQRRSGANAEQTAV